MPAAWGHGRAGGCRWRDGHKRDPCSVWQIPAALAPEQTAARLAPASLPHGQIFAARFSGRLSGGGREGAAWGWHGGQVPWPGRAVTSAQVRVAFWGTGSRAVASTFSLLCSQFNCSVIMQIHVLSLRQRGDVFVLCVLLGCMAASEGHREHPCRSVLLGSVAKPLSLPACSVLALGPQTAAPDPQFSTRS